VSATLAYFSPVKVQLMSLFDGISTGPLVMELMGARISLILVSPLSELT
jgi:hypothetical protein